MNPSPPALVFAIAAAAGVLSLVVARHLRVPGIVVLLAAGVLLGPDVAGLVDPAALGRALPVIVEFAVAIILFEGGLNLELRRLRREAPVIRRLVTAGALVTAAGGALAARLCMGWDWSLAVLFGVLVIVTGPTVITPLLRRIRVRSDVETVLEAEAVLIDPIGAVIALVTLQFMLSPSLGAAGNGLLGILERLGLGLVLGGAGGLALGALLRSRRAIPAGLENIVTLGAVLALYEAAEHAMPETGIMAAAVSGLVVGNLRPRALRDLREFKEQLTLLMVGLLFVLLAADVRLAGVVRLGWPGVATVAVLMLVVRPLDVLASTAGLPVPWNQRAFLAWLAPRGIVAAAVASHFAQGLEHAGRPGGPALLALVFLVIAVTVAVQGLSGGLMARLLRVARGRPHGICLFGAHQLARAMAAELGRAGRDVVLIESNPDFVQQAEAEGFRVVFGNALEERTLLRARLDSMAVCIGVTANEEANMLFAQRAREEFKVREVYVALRDGHESVTPPMLESAGMRLLFDKPRELERWYVRLERGLARVASWELRGEAPGEAEAGEAAPGEEEAGEAAPGEEEAAETAAEVVNRDAAAAAAGDAAVVPGAAAADSSPLDFGAALLPLTWCRDGQVRPYTAGVVLRPGDRLALAFYTDHATDGERWLRARGWEAVDAAVGLPAAAVAGGIR